MNLTPHVLYETLMKEFGSQNWWPMDRIYHKKNHSDPRFEVIIGAILTQNTAWSNVEKALENLKSKNMLEIQKIVESDIKTLQNLVKPSGFFNQKAERIKNLSQHLQQSYHNNLDEFFDNDLHELRTELLSLKGIGLETADSILLYAGNFPIFVVDAYTKRICERLPLNTTNSYNDIQHYFETDLNRTYPEKELMQIYNELHALIVVMAKNHCKKKPVCRICPLQNHCTFKNNLSQ